MDFSESSKYFLIFLHFYLSVAIMQGRFHGDSLRLTVLKMYRPHPCASPAMGGEWLRMQKLNCQV